MSFSDYIKNRNVLQKALEERDKKGIRKVVKGWPLDAEDSISSPIGVALLWDEWSLDFLLSEGCVPTKKDVALFVGNLVLLPSGPTMASTVEKMIHRQWPKVSAHVVANLDLRTEAIHKICRDWYKLNQLGFVEGAFLPLLGADGWKTVLSISARDLCFGEIFPDDSAFSSPLLLTPLQLAWTEMDFEACRGMLRMGADADQANPRSLWPGWTLANAMDGKTAWALDGTGERSQDAATAARGILDYLRDNEAHEVCGWQELTYDIRSRRLNQSLPMPSEKPPGPRF